MKTPLLNDASSCQRPFYPPFLLLPLLQGSVVLLGGAPGVGKSSLLAQLSSGIRSCVERPTGFEESTCKVLYISGEESSAQIRDRVNRLISNNRCLGGVELLATTSVEHVIAAINARKPELVIVDSIQTMGTDMIDSSAGSILQVDTSTEFLRGIVIEILYKWPEKSNEGSAFGARHSHRFVSAQLLSCQWPRHQLGSLRCSLSGM